LARIHQIQAIVEGTRNTFWTDGMRTFTAEHGSAEATGVSVTDDTLTVDLSDGRTISAPLAWYPRLLHASSGERARWRLLGQGRGLHWPDLDEDLRVENLLAGRPSGEGQKSFAGWLAQRVGDPVT